MIFYRFDVSLQSLLDYFEARYDILYFQKLEISAAHSLQLSYESKCSRMHGHNWQIEIFLVSRDKLNEDGMVEDFTHIKKVIHSKMDHANLNEIFDFNPTAENLGKWIVEQFDTCYKVNIQESFGNTATVIDENKIKGIEFIVK